MDFFKMMHERQETGKMEKHMPAPHGRRLPAARKGLGKISFPKGHAVKDLYRTS
jgi:hypothetical protein